jgi:hypothetical protein
VVTNDDIGDNTEGNEDEVGRGEVIVVEGVVVGPKTGDDDGDALARDDEVPNVRRTAGGVRGALANILLLVFENPLPAERDEIIGGDGDITVGPRAEYARFIDNALISPPPVVLGSAEDNPSEAKRRCRSIVVASTSVNKNIELL